MTLWQPQPAEPPADDVQQALAAVRTARAELTDADRIVRMLYADDEPAEQSARLRIERATARHRVALWRVELINSESRARRLGLSL